MRYLPRMASVHPLVQTALVLLIGYSIGSSGGTPLLRGASPQAPPAAQPPTAGAGTEPAGPLADLNQAARVFYTLAKREALERTGPVILVVGDNLVLRKGEERVEVPVIPPTYHLLKEVAHVPLGIDVKLASHAPTDKLPPDAIDELRSYRELIPTASRALQQTALEPEHRERSGAILRACDSFLARVIEQGKCSTSERITFTRKMTPLVLANAGAAARAAIDSLADVTRQWKKRLSADDWNRLTVIVIGRQLPRKGNLATQYFAHILGESGEGKRVVYAEGLGEEPRALDLLATRLVDTQIGIDFFNDEWRMHRDLLSDAARDYIALLTENP